MKLHELAIQPSSQLSVTQQLVLLRAFLSMQISPEAAMQDIKGDEKTITAGEILVRLGMVELHPEENGMQVTQMGIDALVNSGLLDAGTTEPTEFGQKLIDNKETV